MDRLGIGARRDRRTSRDDRSRVQRADLALHAPGQLRDRAGVVNPAGGGFLGEGSSLSRAGVPTIGYIPQPNYLLAGPANGCIEKLSAELMHSQIQVFARLIQKIDAMPAAQLKGST